METKNNDRTIQAKDLKVGMTVMLYGAEYVVEHVLVWGDVVRVQFDYATDEQFMENERIKVVRG